MTQATDRHPVWDVYNELRTARLNVKYYSARVVKTRRMNRTMEVVVAVTAPGSAVPALFFWETPLGKVFWGILLSVASVVAAVKPLLKLDERVRLHEKTIIAFRTLEHDLQALRISIRQDQAYDQTHRQLLMKLLSRKKELAEEEPIEKLHHDLLERCQQEVLSELPQERFYVPAD